MDRSAEWNKSLSFGELFRLTKDCIAENGLFDADHEIRLVFEKTTGMGGSDYFLKRDEPADIKYVQAFSEYVKKRSKGVPLQYILNEAWFYGRSFYVDQSVLIPRYDTEVLVRKALDIIRSGGGRTPDVLDMCTGSGCIIITLSKEEKINAVGADLSASALETARINVERHNADVALIKSDLFESIKGKYDIIVSNPPYIRTDIISTLQREVRDHEPLLALDGGTDGLDIYKRLISRCGCHMNDGGWLCLEIGHDQGNAVASLMRSVGFSDIEIIKDLNGLDRVAAGRRKFPEGYDV